MPESTGSITFAEKNAMPVQFYLTNQKNRAGECPIRVSVHIMGKRYATSVGYSVCPEQWMDNIRENAGAYHRNSIWVLPGTENSKMITAEVINRDLGRISEFLIIYASQCTERPATKVLRTKTRGILGREEDKPLSLTLNQWIDKFIREQSADAGWELSTLHAMHTFQKHIRKFGKAHDLEYFDADGISAFIAYLRKDACLQEVSVKKQYKNLVWLMNWALKNKHTLQDDIKRYRPKFKVIRKPVVFLTREELLRVYHYDVPPNGMVVKLFDYEGLPYEKVVSEAGGIEKARDLFCFCAFTSLRFSDMYKLRRSDIDDEFIHVVTQKTHDTLPINLNSFSRAILDKYKDCRFKDDKALPVVTNQQMNAALKDLCELCGINEPVRVSKYVNGNRIEEVFPKWMLVGTHCARKSFICYALSIGIPPVTVMQWTGHSDYQSMKPYIAIASGDKRNAMNLFEEELGALL